MLLLMVLASVDDLTANWYAVQITYMEHPTEARSPSSYTLLKMTTSRPCGMVQQLSCNMLHDTWLYNCSTGLLYKSKPRSRTPLDT